MNVIQNRSMGETVVIRKMGCNYQIEHRIVIPGPDVIGTTIKQFTYCSQKDLLVVLATLKRDGVTIQYREQIELRPDVFSEPIITNPNQKGIVIPYEKEINAELPKFCYPIDFEKLKKESEDIKRKIRIAHQF